LEPDKGLYVGREQTFVKHLFLTKYLLSAAYKTFLGRSTTFNFVDGFAGPWETSENGNLDDTSFSQSIQVLREVRKNIEASTSKRLHLRFCFCEKKKARFEALKRFAKTQTDVEIFLFHGSFEDNLDNISRCCPDGFTFTFIDPTGFNIRSQEIAEFLAKQKGEFLLNFMSEHINRFPELDTVTKAYGNLLANPEWKVTYDSLPSWIKNESRILGLLKLRLHQLKAGRYFPDFPIKNPEKDRIQMRLVLGTFSRHGVEVFRNTQKAAELQEIGLRQGLQDAKDSQGSLFSADFFAELNQKTYGFGSSDQRSIAKHLVLLKLKENGNTEFEYLIGPVLEQASVNTSMLKDILVDMRKMGIVDFKLAARKRKPQDQTVIALAPKSLF